MDGLGRFDVSRASALMVGGSHCWWLRAQSVTLRFCDVGICDLFASCFWTYVPGGTSRTKALVCCWKHPVSDTRSCVQHGGNRSFHTGMHQGMHQVGRAPILGSLPGSWQRCTRRPNMLKKRWQEGLWSWNQNNSDICCTYLLIHCVGSLWYLLYSELLSLSIAIHLPETSGLAMDFHRLGHSGTSISRWVRAAFAEHLTHRGAVLISSGRCTFAVLCRSKTMCRLNMPKIRHEDLGRQKLKTIVCFFVCLCLLLFI